MKNAYSGTGGVCPVKHPLVMQQLCDTHYPFCRSCRTHYKRWMQTEPEVQKLEAEAALAEKGEIDI